MSSVILSLLLSYSALAGTHFTFTGQVIKIESGIVTLKTKTEEKMFNLKSLSKEEAQLVTKSTGLKKTITVHVPVGPPAKQ